MHAYTGFIMYWIKVKDFAIVLKGFFFYHDFFKHKILYPGMGNWTGTNIYRSYNILRNAMHVTVLAVKLGYSRIIIYIQWNLSITTTSIIKFITCDLFSSVLMKTECTNLLLLTISAF